MKNFVPSLRPLALLVPLALLLTACASSPTESPAPAAAPTGPPNVLFIAVDDLRPQLGCYGHPGVHSPNIDALAASGTRFANAYCNVPVCGASRASLLTGMRPTRTRFVDYDARIEQEAPDAKTIPGHFREHGYYAVAIGKILHFPDDRSGDYSEPNWRPDYDAAGDQGGWRNYLRPENRAISARHDNGAGPPFEAADVPDTAYYDGQTAQRAVEKIAELSQRDQPFFLGVGFLKPHLPFTAPQRYWDQYDPAQFELPPTYFRAEGTPEAIYHNSGELRFGYAGVPEQDPLPEDYARRLIHGYHACVSYTDAQIGRVLNALDEAGVADNTVVVLWGDHGWNLGDHTIWCKHSVFSTSLRTPLIIRQPGKPAGQVSPALTEFVDLFPTLCEAAGLPRPARLDGRSLVPLLSDPDQDWSDAIYTRWKNADNVTTERYSYSEWRNDDGDHYATTLFDHRSDSLELVNLADVPGLDSVRTRLRARLRR